MIELVGVVVSGERGERRLDRCSFAVRPGEILGLVGGTGSGKSSALAVAAGALKPLRGRLVLDGRDVTRSPRKLRGVAGLLAHELPGPFDLTLGEWLELWASLDAVPRAELPGRLETALKAFPLPALHTPVSRLSHGQRRHLALARLWVRRPQVYLLDQPGDALDGTGLRALTAALREVAAQGASVVLADAAPHLAASVCDRVACLEAGQVVMDARRGDAEFEQRIAAAQGWTT
ncbi:MAG: ATP-binding cassette domain-containing protein [Myxococcales bacterium]|nr:ATP-binding cassette domain-containing protein [Myxococcales bacterium]